MSKVEIEYSCKRKKDFVTFIAVAMFFVICLFEVYLIFFLKIQLQHENAMAYSVMKQEMLQMTEILRYRTKMVNPRTPLQECEVMLVTNCLDSVVRFVRRNDKEMTQSQVVAAKDILFQLETYARPWERRLYLFKQKEFNTQPILSKIESKLDQASGTGTVQ